MKRYFVALSFVVVGCSSGQTRMDPVEQEAMYLKYPLIAEQIKSIGESESGRIKFTDCDSENKACLDVECLGNWSDLKCWKTPVAFSESEKHRHLSKVYKPEELKQLIKQCLDPEVSLSLRRKSCLEYLHAPIDKGTREGLASFCDLEGVACKRNGQVWGKGRMPIPFVGNTHSDVINLRSLQSDEMETYSTITIEEF